MSSAGIAFQRVVVAVVLASLAIVAVSTGSLWSPSGAAPNCPEQSNGQACNPDGGNDPPGQSTPHGQGPGDCGIPSDASGSPHGGSGNGCGVNQAPATPIPPTTVPPTPVPPTNVPPTAVPPTNVPPTNVPPTAVPPTNVPPTNVPPTNAPNSTSVPITSTPAATSTPEATATGTPPVVAVASTTPGSTPSASPGPAATTQPAGSPTSTPRAATTGTSTPLLAGAAAAQPGPSSTATPGATSTRIPSATATPFLPARTQPPAPTPEPAQEVAAARIEIPRTFLSNVPGWSNISHDLDVVGTNLLLALIALLTLLVATTVFNSTMEENAMFIESAALKFSASSRIAPVAAKMGWLSADEAGGSPFLLTLIKPAIIVGITAAIYAALEPSFGWNDETLVLMVSLVASLAMATFLYEGGQVLWSTRYDTPASLRLYPLAILIAVGCVAVTRLTNLHPGIIFGFVAAAALFPRGAMTARQEGMIVLVPLLGLMIVSAVAFLLIDPLRRFSQDNPGVLGLLPETIAVALFVGGASSALLILLPVTFNDGQKIFRWNRLVWFALALPAAFAFIHIVVNDEDFVELMDKNGAIGLAIVSLVVLAIAFATWSYFKLRQLRRAAL